MMGGFETPPIVVGGVGGSGTRLVAKMLQTLGIFIGDDLNHAYDNMRLARVFPAMRDRIQSIGSIGTVAEPTAAAAAGAFVADTLSEFTREMRAAYLRQHAHRAGWGWKVPSSYSLLAHLAASFPGLVYVHVIRHGVDMAFSANRNQLRNWGRHYGVNPEAIPPERAALAFWIAANRRTVAEARRLRIRFLLLNFDDLCRQPAMTAGALLDFLGHPRQALAEVLPLVNAPQSLGRRVGHDLGFVGPDEQQALAEFGFDFP